MRETDLTVSTEVPVRFNEADAMGVVWHGHYIKFFEDGREAFGLQHGIRYLDVFANGYMTPIVRVECDYKLPIQYGDTAIVETRFVPTPAAKIIFSYVIRRKSDGKIAATGSTIQVFINDQSRELVLTCPAFYEDWKSGNGLM